MVWVGGDCEDHPVDDEDPVVSRERASPFACKHIGFMVCKYHVTMHTLNKEQQASGSLTEGKQKALLL